MANRSYPLAGTTDIDSGGLNVHEHEQLRIFAINGVNARDAICGQAQLVIGPGAVTINTTAIQANSLIYISHADNLGTSALYPRNIVPGVSFDVVSGGGGGNSDLFNWLILNPP